jgi:hypothetical protein
MKIIAIFLMCFILLNAKDRLIVQQQNVLYIQNLIEIEEKIARNFEKYLLEEFDIPTISELKTDDYLGSNFTTTNKFGPSTDLDISFVTSPNLKIKYAITEDVQIYVSGLYKRDLYRDMTSVYENTSDVDKSYVSFELKSKEAENIFDILKAGANINSECSSTLTNTYCITNLNTIRWYDASSNWIEYNNSDFEEGNVTISTYGLLTNTKLDNLNVGAFIYVKNGDKYLKILDDIVKVD